MKTEKTELITDEQSFDDATYSGGNYQIQTYDDGYGPLWISRCSIGIMGIVRARTWEDAYSICEDEFFPEADETIEDIVKEYGFKREHVKMINDGGVIRPAVYLADYPDGKLADTLKFERWETIETPNPDAWVENELFQEAFGFRNNGPNKRDVLNHGIYSKDLNGDALDLLTAELIDDLGIVLQDPTTNSRNGRIVRPSTGTANPGTEETSQRRIENGTLPLQRTGKTDRSKAQLCAIDEL